MDNKTVKVIDKEFEIFIPNSKINEAIQKVADQINKDYNKQKPLLVVILNGAFMFASDLMQKLTIECEISFVKLSSYQGTRSTEKVKKIIGLNESVEGRPVIIVEDIVDTGITMENLLAEFKNLKPSSVRIATLLFKPQAFQKDYEVHYIGLDIPNDFIVGYGLDYDGFARNLPDIYKIIK